MRGLDESGEFNPLFVNSADLRAVLYEWLDRPRQIEQRAADEHLYKLLGLIPQDADLEAIYKRLLGGFAGGFYDEQTGAFYVLSSGGEGLDAGVESVYVHEYVHRLQDVAYDLDLLLTDVGGNRDREMALLALVEGDASVFQARYDRRYIDRNELDQARAAFAESYAAVSDLPYVLRRTLEFNYFEGSAFIREILESAGPDLDELYATPPSSTEQILHPEKYLAGEHGEEVRLPDVAAILGPGWSQAHRDTLGELLLRTWLAALSDGVDAIAAAEGWGGDRYVLLDGPDGRVALAGIIVWDDPQRDGEEFVSTLAAALDHSEMFSEVGVPEKLEGVSLWESPAGAFGSLLRDDGTVLIAAGPDPAFVTRLLAGLNGQP